MNIFGWFKSHSDLLKRIDLIEVKIRHMNTRQSELEAKLNAMGDKVTKIIAEVETLKGTLVDAPISDAAQASLDRLDGLLQKADDENPDAVPPTQP